MMSLRRATRAKPHLFEIAPDQSTFELKDKDGFVPCLIAVEMTARIGSVRGEICRSLTQEFGDPLYGRVEAPANRAEEAVLDKLSVAEVKTAELDKEKVEAILTRAPGNGAPIEEPKVVAQSVWFAARPSGIENIYKICAESFHDDAHLRQILEEVQTIVGAALTGKITAKAGLSPPSPHQKRSSEAGVA